jgi:hypothetical protein
MPKTFKIKKREIWQEVAWDVKEENGNKVLVFIFEEEMKMVEIPFGENAAQSLAGKMGKITVETAPAGFLQGLPGGPGMNGHGRQG